MRKDVRKIGLALVMLIGLGFSVFLRAQTSKALLGASVLNQSEPYIYSLTQKRNIPVRDVRDEVSRITKSAPRKPAEGRGLRLTNKMRLQSASMGQPQTIGLYRPSSQTFHLRYSNTSGGDDLSFGYGGPGSMPITGDWNGDRVGTVGLYDPANARFLLRNSNSAGGADITVNYGAANQGFIPIVGDWDGDGVDTVGLYDPAHAAFFLRNSNTDGVADITFTYGPAGWGFIPIVGDWNGDGVDSVGLYDPANAAFFLRNSNSGGVADLMFTFGPAGQGFIPLAGDWDGDGADTIGLYDPTYGGFFLRNSNTGGIADVMFSYAGASAGDRPLAGHWAPPPGGFGMGDEYTDAFQNAFFDRTELDFTILCPTQAGGNNSHTLYLTSTNRATLGVEALISYEAQDPLVFEVYDWARPESSRWQVFMPYYTLSNYLTTITVGGISYQAVNIYNSTRNTNLVIAGPDSNSTSTDTVTVWANSVYLTNFSTGDFDLVYRYEYEATPADQKTGVHSWGPIFELFQPQYSNLNPMGFYQCFMRSGPDAYGDLRLYATEVRFVPPSFNPGVDNGLRLLYLEPNYTFTAH
jgi:hypothetical protein